MKKVVVVGTNHDIQQGKKYKNEFFHYIKELCECEEIKVIAEEINDDAECVVARDVCNDLSIRHIIIDPNPKDYESLGIVQYHVVECSVMSEYCLKNTTSDENSTPVEELNEFRRRIALEHHIPREREWRKRIEENDCWPTLVICGSAHFESFCNLLEEKGIGVIKKDKNWVG